MSHARSLSRTRNSSQLFTFFGRPASAVARDLVGSSFTVGGVGGAIVKVEAYEAEDPASHSFGGQTERNGAMFGVAGTLYVCRLYGLHWCANFVCLPGHADLLRAIEPTTGLNQMVAKRGVELHRVLCSGPGRLIEALGIDGAMNGLRLDRSPFRLNWRTSALRS